MSPEQDKLFIFLCAISLTASDIGYYTNSDEGLLKLYKIHIATMGQLGRAGQNARISLRVRIALERIIQVSRAAIVQVDVHKTRLAIVEAANFGTEKPKLLNTVTDKTWREQCAGRARLAMKRDDPLKDLTI